MTREEIETGIRDEMAIGSEPRHRRGSVPQYFVPWALCWAVVVHTLTAIGLIFEPEQVKQVAVLVGLDLFLDIGVPPRGFAVVLLLASVMAAYGISQEGLNHPRRQLLLLALFPQYFLVTVGLVNDVFILVQGEFNGQQIDFWQGVVGLGTIMVMGLFHNASIVERYFLKWNRRR